MNYARAVKGALVNSEVIAEIQDQVKLELQRYLTNEELRGICRKYSLQELSQNIRKVV